MKNVMLGFCLIVLIGCGTSNAYQKPSVRIVGEAQMTKLPNGNYEVTPRWIKDRFNAENSMVKQLEDCREGGWTIEAISNTNIRDKKRHWTFTIYIIRTWKG